MICLTKAREAQGLSKRRLGVLSNVDASDIARAENRGLRLYPVQLERIAEALGWEERPEKLLEAVKDE